MGTDFKAVLLYLCAVPYHPNWAALTLLWIVVPFFVHAAKFAYHLIFRTGEADWKDLLLHVPFVLPLRNLHHAYRLFGMSFGIEEGSFWVTRLGMRPFNSKDWAAVEEIQREVTKAGLTETFCESGPQAVQQAVISLSTGHFRGEIIFSTIVSVLALTWGASRAYFIERGQDEADPDPALLMVALRVFPLMFLVVVNSMLNWIVISGLLGPSIFLALLVTFIYTIFCFFYLTATPANGVVFVAF